MRRVTHSTRIPLERLSLSLVEETQAIETTKQRHAGQHSHSFKESVTQKNNNNQNETFVEFKNTGPKSNKSRLHKSWSWFFELGFRKIVWKQDVG